MIMEEFLAIPLNIILRGGQNGKKTYQARTITPRWRFGDAVSCRWHLYFLDFRRFCDFVRNCIARVWLLFLVYVTTSILR